MTHLTTVDLSVSGPVATLRLNRPECRNALSPETLIDLLAALEEVNCDERIRIAHLCGAGTAFSVGFDLQSMAKLVMGSGLPSEAELREMAETGGRLLERLRGLNAITVASAQGYAMGGGFLLFTACDFRLCADDIVFGLPEVDIGLPLIWGGVPLLKEELGPSLARDVVMTGRRFGPTDLAMPGFLQATVPASDLKSATERFMGGLLEKPPLALRLLKEQFRVAPPSRPEVELMMETVRDPDFLTTAMSYVQGLRKK
jgi:enoyl-CoA hydratase/carnithine racemase